MSLPKGFRYAGVAAGLKAGGALDVGLLVSDRPASAAGVVTTNRFQAAPVLVSLRHLASGRASAIAVNAKNANACTGAPGIADAELMATIAAAALGIEQTDVLVASTGVIGRPMPMAQIDAGLRAAADVLGDDPTPLSLAIMTTDTRPKTAGARAGATSIVGVAKGAGMIAPEMATMLCFIATDAAIDPALLSETLADATERSFNTISVDGCMSTNDCIFVLANGAAGASEITRGSEAHSAFRDALTDVCASLARQIVEDGEGISKVVTITVRGADSRSEAVLAARRIADSVLLRCALGGADPNWGRVLAALGTAQIPLDPNAVDVWMGGELLAEGGSLGPGDLEKAALALREREIEIIVDLHRGSDEASMLTNDLTAEYVAINADYTT